MSIENTVITANTIQPHHELLRLRHLMVRMCVSRSTIYRLISTKGFPKPIQLGAVSVAWVSCEIDDWIHQQIENRNRKETV